MGNPQVGIGCAKLGTCNAEETLLENMRINLGLDVATKAEARAAAIIADLNAGRIPDVRLRTEARAEEDEADGTE
jgi:hypothetical protein